MTDPLRSDRQPVVGDMPDRDRDARIEELLLAGLTHYFADQHELAINVWTRVLFIDRGHARARAYIERARSAVSERQRQGDELLHSGALALDQGNTREARQLVASAVEHGVSADEALAVLARIDRLETATAPRPSAARRSDTAITVRSGAAGRRPTSHWVLAGVAGVVLGAGAILLIGRADLVLWSLAPPATATQQGLLTAPVPVPTAAEVALTRGEALSARGRLDEALLALAAVPAGDPLRARADELTSAIQKQLLAAARGAEATPEAATRRP
jgi:tetratricopeptide (TPR) repeat protein